MEEGDNALLGYRNLIDTKLSELFRFKLIIIGLLLYIYKFDIYREIDIKKLIFIGLY